MSGGFESVSYDGELERLQKIGDRIKTNTSYDLATELLAVSEVLRCLGDASLTKAQHREIDKARKLIQVLIRG
jgi:hypothetical protein